MGKTAIILGATGLTGGILLQKLIEDNRYTKVKLFSRNKIEGLPSKVNQFVGNMLELENFKKDFTGDEVFCCIGTTAKKTPNKETYRKIDVVVSAIGANAKSSVFYNRTKGEMEQEVLRQNILNTYVLQPSIIGGNRSESRIGEKVGLAVFKIVQPLFFGKLKKYKITEAEHIAQTMLNLANSTSEKQIITSEQIELLATKN